jgi:uncharacterized protein YbjT (DUF2867 family)
MQPSTIFLAGASRGVGLEVAKILTQQQIPTIALLRSPIAQPTLEAMGVTVRCGDAMVSDDLETAMGDVNISTLISTVGGKSIDGVRSDFTANRNLIDAAVKFGVQRFILITSLGTGNSVNAIPASALEVLGEALAAKHQAEQHLIASGLIYTIIRPGGLKSEPATGNAVLTADPTIGGLIYREDVADLICQCVKSDRSYNQTLAAVDRNLRSDDRAFEVFEL